MASNGLIAMVERDRALRPYAIYRIAFGLTILAVLGDRGGSRVESVEMNEQLGDAE